MQLGTDMASGDNDQFTHSTIAATNGAQDDRGVNNATSTSSSFSLEYVDSEEESSSSDSTFEVDD